MLLNYYYGIILGKPYVSIRIVHIVVCIKVIYFIFFIQVLPYKFFSPVNVKSWLVQDKRKIRPWSHLKEVYWAGAGGIRLYLYKLPTFTNFDAPDYCNLSISDIYLNLLVIYFSA